MHLLGKSNVTDL